MHRILVAVLATALPLAAMGEGAAAPGGAHLGVGYGAARLSSTRGGGGQAPALRVRVGVARTSRVAFGLEGGLVANERVQLSSYDVAATVFPWERFFYVRAGVGLTTLSFRDHPDERGANVLVGAGVALGGASGLNVTANVDAQYHRTVVAYGSGAQAASSASAWLGVEWR